VQGETTQKVGERLEADYGKAAAVTSPYETGET